MKPMYKRSEKRYGQYVAATCIRTQARHKNTPYASSSNLKTKNSDSTGGFERDSEVCKEKIIL